MTFTIGGNDADFADIVENCAFGLYRPRYSTCQAAIGKTVGKALAALPAKRASRLRSAPPAIPA